MKKIIIIGASPRSLVNFRGELIKSFVCKGLSVVALAGGVTDDESCAIESLGARYIDVPVNRTSTNPFTDLNTMRFFEKVFAEEKPDHVIAYTIKPVIWGGLAVKKFPNIRFTALITGLGYAFEGQGFKRGLLRFIASRLYKSALDRANKVVFQNHDDLNYFIERNLVVVEKTNVVSGSGVPLDDFKQQPFPKTDIVFLMVARLLKEKGVYHFVEAACRLKKQFPNVSFQLLGGLDPSPDGINQSVVDKWVQHGCIEYLGETKDVRPYFSKSHVFVLPSFYREGLPRTILEAMATGRPILTTDNVGCREPVVEEQNGWLVPVRDTGALTEKMIWFIEHPEQIEPMGLASRKMAEEKFDVHKVNARMLEIMGLTE
jgi:glycosyltransferase involved in cell wall biosynthesis